MSASLWDEIPGQSLRTTFRPPHTGFLVLWHYLLAEANHHGGQRLGPVGSTIIADVLIGLVRRSDDSYRSPPFSAFDRLISACSAEVVPRPFTAVAVGLQTHRAPSPGAGIKPVALQGTRTSLPRTWPDWLMR